MEKDEIMKIFLQERNEALLSLDRKKIVAYMNKYDIPVQMNKTVFWAGIHKARISIVDFPEAEKEKSRKWLKRRGFSCEVI